MEKFLATFGSLRDPRAANVQHSLCTILFLALAAILCGARNCQEIADFAAEMSDMFEDVIDLKHGTPSHDTFSRVFRLLDPDEFSTAFQVFTEAFGRRIQADLSRRDTERVIAVDGKALRRAFESGAKATPLHLVNAWAQGEGLCLGQCLAPGRNEVEGAINLIGRLELDNAIVTTDALHCHKRFAAAVLARGGDYALALKGNQAKLLKAASALVDDCNTAKISALVKEVSHGRTETRQATVVDASKLAETHEFPGLKAVVRMERTRQLGDREQHEIRYFLLSRALSPEAALRIIRAHWSIENSLHWVLDVNFGEDNARNRKDHGPVNLACLRRLALNILRADPHKASIQRKIRRAGWNHKYLLELLSQMQ